MWFIYFMFLLTGAACFLLAALDKSARALPLGLLLWILVPLIQTVHGHSF